MPPGSALRVVPLQTERKRREVFSRNSGGTTETQVCAPVLKGMGAFFYGLLHAEEKDEIRERFAPLLCKKAGELFYRLTEGKYDRVTLDRAMRVTVHPTGSTTDRSLSYLSGGTVDQLYLALRLAICDLLLPDCPIILDDALVYFDDERLRVALEVLRELGRQRQILLFTCTDREKRMLDASR